MNAKPSINVTPLIDVLLVLLIIFMVITPLKPTNFKAQIPQEPKNPTDVETNILSLVVGINSDSTLRLNTENELGTVENPEELTARLREIFKDRLENRAYDEKLAMRNDLSEFEKVQKTVFIKAPRSANYGNVVKIIDAVKLSGAKPISLQIDDLQ